MRQYQKDVAIFEYQYYQYLSPEMSFVREVGMEVPKAEVDELLSFIKDHGFLTYSIYTEYSTKGFTTVRIYGQW